MNPLDQVAGPSKREDDQGAPPAKRSKTKYFSNSWLTMPEFSGWLQAVQNSRTKAFCTWCEKYLKCGKSEFHRHAATNIHIRNAALASLKAPIDVEPEPQPQVDEQSAHKAAVKSAEFKLLAFFDEHNVGTEPAEHLVPLIKQCFKDSRIAQDVTLGRTECSEIITDCFGARELQNSVDIIKGQKFSVLVDENTDITDTKTLCVLVQFVSPDTKKVVTELLELIKLDETNSSAENVYATFKSCLQSKGIPISNVVGIASDNASDNTGIHNSFVTRLNSDAPGLVVLNCTCHSSALVASKACDTLPRSCEDLIRNIAMYESGSAKNSAVLREFQELLEVETRKILKLSETRWLSLQKCVDRLLDNWDALKIFFALAVNEDKLRSAETILMNLSDDIIRAYMLFLKYSLYFFNSFKGLFQSRKVLIHKLTESSRLLILQFGGNFMKPEVLKELSTGSLIVLDPANFLALDQIVLGPECEEALSKIPEMHAKEVRETCLRFYVTAMTEMASRLPLKPSLLDDLRFLAPNIALNLSERGSVRDLSAIAKHFGTFDLTKLAFEWNTLPSSFTDQMKKSLLALEVDSFWKEIVQSLNLMEEKMFPVLEQIVEIVLSLPHSNAEAERIFSTVTDGKTKKRII